MAATLTLNNCSC